MIFSPDFLVGKQFLSVVGVLILVLLLWSKNNNKFFVSVEKSVYLNDVFSLFFVLLSYIWNEAKASRGQRIHNSNRFRISF